MANWTLSSNVNPSVIFALVNDLIVRIVRSTKPVPVCKFGVHLMRLTFSSLQYFLNSLLLKQLPLSVLMHRGVPLSVKYFVKKFQTVRVTVFLQICAVGHLLKRSMATKIYTSLRVFDLIGPAKSNWISWLDSVETSRLFFLRRRNLCNNVLTCGSATGARFRLLFYFSVYAGPQEGFG